MDTEDTHTPGAFQINSLGVLVWTHDIKQEINGIALVGLSLFFIYK